MINLTLYFAYNWSRSGTNDILNISESSFFNISQDLKHKCQMNLAADIGVIITDGGRKNSSLWGFEILWVEKKIFHLSGKKLNRIINTHQS